MEFIMNTNSFRNIVATASLVAGLASVSSAQADVVNGSLGTGASATDHYHVTCPAFNSRLEGNVTDLVPVAAPLVSMQIHKGNGAINTTDPVDGFQFIIAPPSLQQVPSPTVSLFGGLGAYDVLIDKTAAGVENYRMYVQCFGGFTGGTLPTTIVQVQNQ
jgi:hypothetical protein